MTSFHQIRRSVEHLAAWLLVATLWVIAAGRVGAETGAPDKPLEERILGYWAPNWDEISASRNWRAMFKSLAELSLGDRSEAGLAKAEKEVADEVKELCRVMTMEFTRDKSIQHTGSGRAEEQRFVVKKVDPATGTIELELPASHGGPPELGRLVLKGDRLTFTGLPEESSTPWILDRIDKETFEKRQAAAAESKRFKNPPQKPQDSPAPEVKKPARSAADKPDAPNKGQPAKK